MLRVRKNITSRPLSLRGSFIAEAISLTMGETASQKDARSDKFGFGFIQKWETILL